MKNCLSIEMYRKTIIFYSFSNGVLPYASDRAYFAKNAARFGGRLALYKNTDIQKKQRFMYMRGRGYPHIRKNMIFYKINH